MNEVNCQMEKITISPETRRKFADAGKVRRTFKPKKLEPIQTPTLSTERLEEIQQEHKEHTQSLSLLARLTSERKSLEERLSDPPLPLIERIDYSTPTYHFSPPLPTGLHFRQTKKLLRIKEFKNLVEPTLDRISPFFKYIGEERIWAMDERLDPIWVWFKRLEDIVIEMDTIGHNFSNGEWRMIKGACKRLKNVDFTQVATRVSEICNTLLLLDIVLP